MQRAIREIDPRLTFNKFRTIEDVQGEAMTPSRVQALLLAALAGIALALCVAGVYGLVANSVVERRRELGVRMALGATPAQTVKTAAAAGVGLTLCGTALGLLLSMLVTGLMRQMVFGMPVNDPLTLTGGGGNRGARRFRGGHRARLAHAQAEYHSGAEQTVMASLIQVVETFVGDVRYAFRSLRRRPAFAVGAIAALAVGMGVTTVGFSAVNALLINGPMSQAAPGAGGILMDGTRNSASFAEFEDVRRQVRSLSTVTASVLLPIAYQTPGASESILGCRRVAELLGDARRATAGRTVVLRRTQS